jgi:DNA-directed RNA polymerase specialized sigma24 family protein
MKQSKIIEYLKNGQHQRAFTKLYAHFPKVEKHILKNSGTKAEASDIFQEALIILYKKINEVNDQLSVEGYLINTSKLLWSNELRKKKVRQKSSSVNQMPIDD